MSTQTRPVRRLTAPTPRAALVIAALVVIAVVLYLGRSALAPFIIGALIVYLLDPAVGWVSRLRIGRRAVPRGLAVLIVYAVVLIVLVQGLRLLLGPLVSQLLEYVRNLPALIASLQAMLDELARTYQAIDLPPAVREFIDDALADLGSGAGGIDFGSLLPVARSLASTAASFFGYLIIPVWAFYVLKDRVRLQQQFLGSLPASWREEVWTLLTIMERVFGRWIRGQLLLGLIVGVLTFIGLMVLGWLVDPRFIEFAVLLAVIAGVLELLPIIGPIIAMIPTLLVALTTGDPGLAAVGVLVLYIGVQQVENNVLVPKIQGDAVELHPSVVIFALIIGGAIAGLLGAILAIPITAAARDVYRYLMNRLSEDEPVAQPAALPEMKEGAEKIEAPAPASSDEAAKTPQPRRRRSGQ